MVLLAAAICNKTGKTIISRQFVEMTRSRIEGLLAAFPKLMGTGGKQHTFVETESVRYVYQPLDKLYMLLITTRASNILEDLETLRLFARVIPEYCRSMEEGDIVEQAFPLIFAFDEIVALGYRENVNLAQIRTFTEMDSHEERVYNAVRQTQEKEAKENMKKRVKELQQQKRDMDKRGLKAAYAGGMGGGGSYQNYGPTNDSMNADLPKVSYTAVSKPQRGGTGMKIGTKKKDVDSFVDQLQSEGERVLTKSGHTPSATTVRDTGPRVHQEPVHIRLEEKISATVGRDGGLQSLDVHGMMHLHIADEHYGRIRVAINNSDTKGIQLQTHPNVDKKLFSATSLLGLKNPEKPFPLHQDIGVLKWHLQTQDDSLLPLSINCWPSEAGSSCDVNIEYELEMTELELQDVVISIPLPPGSSAPVVTECDAEYRYDNRRNVLEWTLAVIDSDNRMGSLEFSMNGHADDFFPINLSFSCPRCYCDIELSEVRSVDDDKPVKYSSETRLNVDKYQIV